MRSDVKVCLTLLTIFASALLIWVFGSALAPEGGNWPYWRGPSADGMAVGDAPLDWSATRNVRWKADIPGRGFSSPIVWDDRIFLTTAIPTGKPTEPDKPAERSS